MIVVHYIAIKVNLFEAKNQRSVYSIKWAEGAIESFTFASNIS